MFELFKIKFIMAFFLVLGIVSFSLAQVAIPQSEMSKDEGKYYKSHADFNQQVKIEYEKKMSQGGQSHIIKFSQELFVKSKELELKKIALKKREEKLKILQQEVSLKLKGFYSKQQNILGCLDENEKKVAGRISHIVNIVTGMKPQKAAAVLTVQDPDITVKVIALLPHAKLSKIFNKMDKEVSARLQKQYLTMKK